jgi:hypothetical protein
VVKTYFGVSPGRIVGGFGPEGTFPELDLLPAASARTGLVEFIGKDLELLPAIGAVAEKRFEIPELLESRAMTRRAHGILLSLQAAERIVLSA